MKSNKIYLGTIILFLLISVFAGCSEDEEQKISEAELIGYWGMKEIQAGPGVMIDGWGEYYVFDEDHSGFSIGSDMGHLDPPIHFTWSLEEESRLYFDRDSTLWSDYSQDVYMLDGNLYVDESSGNSIYQTITEDSMAAVIEEWQPIWDGEEEWGG